MSVRSNIRSLMNRRHFLKAGAAALGAGVASSYGLSRRATASGLVLPRDTKRRRPLQNGKMDRVVASWLPIMQTTAYYVALEEGLFEEAGIEIESVKFENPNQIIDSLISGRADFGPPGAAAGIAVLAETRSRGSLKVFGLQGGGIEADRTNDVLLVPNDSPVTSFADLKGKTIGTVPGIQWRTITRFLVRQNGLDPDKDVRVTELAVGLQMPSVVAGSVDATLSLEPVGSIASATQQAKRAMINPCSMFISDPFYSGASVLSSKFIEERPDVAKRVVEVIDEATRLANEDFDTYRPVLAKYTALEEEQASYVAQPRLRGFRELDDRDLDSYQKFVNVFSSEGVLKAERDINEILLDGSTIGL
ncbi:MAG: ABC transporter substrate-binding protein [Cyanobacteria bacterium P01_F01_bin.86]